MSLIELPKVASDADVNSSLEEEKLAKAAQYTEYVDQHTSQWETMKKYPFACCCVLALVFILICTSFESQAGGIVIAIATFREDFGDLQPDGSYVINASYQSAFSGVPLAAQIVGQWTGSWLSDRFGKRWVIFCALMVSVAFIGIEFAATSVQIFLLGKTLNGYCLGIVQALCVTYVADITPLALRGASTSLCNISFSIGPMVCFIINYSLSDNTTRWAYRSIFAAQWGFAIVSMLILLVIPESPTFYVMRGQLDKAEKCYLKLLRDPVAAVDQLAVVEDAVKTSQRLEKGSTYLDCFKGTNLRRTVVATMPFIFCPFSGVYFTGSYTSYWFELAGYSSSETFKLTIGAQTLSITGCIIATLISDRIGRRTNILFGVAAIGIANFIIGGTGTVTDSTPILRTTVAFMMLYGLIYNLGLGSVCYTIATENPTPQLRTKTVGIALSGTNVSGMVWSFVIPYLFNTNKANLQAKTMLIYAGFCVVFWFYFFFFTPETKGRTTQEIDELYGSGISLRKFDTYVTEASKISERTFGPDGTEKKVGAEHLEFA